jgi:hypothetical protein
MNLVCESIRVLRSLKMVSLFSRKFSSQQSVLAERRLAETRLRELDIATAVC